MAFIHTVPWFCLNLAVAVFSRFSCSSTKTGSWAENRVVQLGAKSLVTLFTPETHPGSFSGLFLLDSFGGVPMSLSYSCLGELPLNTLKSVSSHSCLLCRLHLSLTQSLRLLWSSIALVFLKAAMSSVWNVSAESVPQRAYSCPLRQWQK